MNKFLKLELDKISDLPVEQLDETHYVIHKQSTSLEAFSVGKRYIVELAKYITNPPPNFTLQDNWNKGIVPISNTLEISVIGKVGKMIKTESCGVVPCSDTESLYSRVGDHYEELWLPEGGLTKITEHYYINNMEA